MCTFLSLKHKNAICDGTLPSWTPTLVYVNVQRSQTFKQLNYLD